MMLCRSCGLFCKVLLNCFFSGILVPGGFGVRGVEGMILAAQWARKTKIPFLGMFYVMYDDLQAKQL